MHLTGWAAEGAESLLVLVHPQNWDLTFTKSRLEHKFCAWHYARLGSVDAVHAFLMITVPLFLMLWPLCNADACLPALPHWVNGMTPALPLNVLVMAYPRTCSLLHPGVTDGNWLTL